MTKVYLIRHCEARGNIDRIFHGHTDAAISKNGIKQLEKLSERCKSLHFDSVYSSPLIRAYKTAEAANLYHGLPIVTRDGLKEINGGHWEGKYFAELPLLFPDENKNWEKSPWNFKVVGGESMADVYDRIWNTVTDIVKENYNKSVCIVSHGCAIRNFLCRAYGKPLKQLHTVEWCENTAVSIIDFDEQLNSAVIMANDASHLDESLSTVQKQDWWKNQYENNVR